MVEGVSTLRAVSDAVLAVAPQRSVYEVLQQLVDRARERGGARYAALGIPDDAGGFSRFLVSGLTDAEIAALGPLLERDSAAARGQVERLQRLAREALDECARSCSSCARPDLARGLSAVQWPSGALDKPA